MAETDQHAKHNPVQLCFTPFFYGSIRSILFLVSFFFVTRPGLLELLVA